MKKLSFVLLSSMALLFSACQPKVDTEKEKEAIKSVFEQEKNAFFNQDNVVIGETWVKESSSAKIFMDENGQTRFEGWENINASIKKETEDTSWNRKLVKANFLNYKIDVMDKSAWVMCDTHWEGIFRGDTMSVDQSRICILKKVDDKWKFALMAIYNIPKELKK